MRSMGKTCTAAAALRVAIIISLASLLFGCGQHARRAASIITPTTSYTLQDALTELDALERPEGVDAKVWEELKGALREALEAKALGEENGSGELQFATTSEVSRPGGRESLSTAKLVSKPPTGAANKVNDLTATRETNGDFTLSWHYRNLGDYDQNGVVGVSDITPLAMHYNETYDAVAQPDCIQAVVDGSGNGKIGVEDVTQLAQYFGNEFALYAMQGGDQQQGPFTQAFTMELPAEGRSDARLAFTYNLFDIPEYTYWRVVPLDSANNPGEASNVVALNVEAPVRVLGVTPLEGLAGADVTFTAFVTGTGPFTYEWDFGGGATPNLSTAAQPTVTLNDDAVDTQYAAQVKVTGANGSATRHFTLTVATMPGEPPVINSVGPFSGLSGEQLNFSADVTGDGPLTYSWEFDGGASPPVSADANPTAILSRGGTLPAPNKDYPCRLTVTNEFGTASADFTLTVSAQWHVEDLPYVPYRTKGIIESARFSDDGELCGVSWYYIEASGTMVIAFLRYVGGQWEVEPAATGNFIPYFSGMNLCFTSAGSPVIAWGDESDGAVHITRETGGEWRHEVVAPGGAFHPVVNLMLDSQDRAVIAFAYFTGNGNESAFKIARQNGASWDIFDYPQGSPEFTALTLDGRVEAVNNTISKRKAILYRETDAGWSEALVHEAPVEVDATPWSLVVDATGLAHIAIGRVDGLCFVARETPGGEFESDQVNPRPDGAIDLFLVPEVGEVALFSSISGDAPVIVAWKDLNAWVSIASPIISNCDFIHLLVHPNGFPVLESGTQMGAYW